MEFPFNLEKLLSTDAEGFAIIDGRKNPSQLSGANRAISRAIPDQLSYLNDVIDKMGSASTKAQGLPAVITSASRLFTSDNRLYIKAEGNRAIGIIKVGVKKLFIRNELGQIKEISPLCVLDFYVHESVQRGGHGKGLFEKMLACEGVRPEKLGYDKPSDKFIAFLGKHYGLKRYVPQNNNYVVFSAYFDTNSSVPDKAQQASQEANSFFSGFGAQQPRRGQPQQAPFAQTLYQPQTQKESLQGNAPANNIVATQNNFYNQQQSQMKMQQKQLPPKSMSKPADNCQLSNIGQQQIFGSNSRGALPQSNASKRSSTTDRVFGGSQMASQ